MRRRTVRALAGRFGGQCPRLDDWASRPCEADLRRSPAGRALRDQWRFKPNSRADYNRSLRQHMAKTPPPAPPAIAPASYEDALSELERLVAAMEGGQLPLDRLLDNYQRGAELLTLCRSRLEAVEQQVKVLEDGQLKSWSAS